MPSLAELVRARGLLTQGEAAAHVAGEAIRGSWWSHPAGQRIFRALTALETDRDVLSCKLVGGKVTLVHRRLWPALVRVQAEPSLWPPLSPAARALLGRVRRTGRLAASGPTRLELERSLRVLAEEEHTPAGAHRVTLLPFERWIGDGVAKAAARLSLEEALAMLAVAGYAPGGRAARRGGKATPGPRRRSRP